MNREQFLQSHWQAYPTVSRRMQEFYDFGRVLAWGENSLDILAQGQKRSLLSSGVEKGVEFGAAIPLALLLPGDVVAVKKDGGPTYLLAPNLVGGDVIEDHSHHRHWSDFLAKIRQFFKDRDFWELDTPYLVTSPGVDHHIDFMSVTASHSGRQWTLPTSPEIELKKRLCAGADNIFEIKRCFRDDLESDRHHVEFTMLEWYRSFSDLEDLSVEVGELIQFLCPSSPALKISELPQIFEAKTGLALTPQTTLEQLIHLANELHISWDSSDDWNDVFFRIYMEKVEPDLGQQGPELVRYFPPTQASLAQLNQRGWCERFELYWRGVELGNAFLEVNDPRDNEKRFGQEEDLRKNKGRKTAPQDQAFFNALKRGLPPSAGIAVGLDRLFQAVQS